MDDAIRIDTPSAAPAAGPHSEDQEMPFKASDGRDPVPGMKDAYYATPEDLQTYHDAARRLSAMQPNLPDFDISTDRNRYVFVAAFDGTGNDATQTLTERTNVHALYNDFDRFVHGNGTDQPGFSRMHARYIEGPGTQNAWGNTIDNASGTSVQDRVWEMYKDLGDKTRQWKQENPDAEISVITFGFSRGAVEAAEFASVVGKYGIHAEVGYRMQDNDDHRHDTIDPETGNTIPDYRQFRELSGELVAPGKVPIAAALYDPVATGVAEDHDRMLPTNISSALQITARDEHRVLFPVNRTVTDDMVQADPDRFANITVAGCHSDIGGGYADGKGLAQINANLVGDYLNKVVGHQICKTVQPDPEAFVVHDSNSTFFQSLGYLKTMYRYADRTQDGPTVQDGTHVRSGVDQNITGRTMTAFDSVHMHPGHTVDDSYRPSPSNVESRLQPRTDDGHTPRPYAAKHSLQDETLIGPQRQRTVDPVSLVMESSARVSTLMDRDTNPVAAQRLHDIAHGTDIRHSILSNGDSAAGRLSAAVALAAKEQGMDRIGEVTFNADRTQLLIADRRDTHTGQVKHATVDIAAALERPMKETLFDVHRPMVRMEPRPQNLYEQAYEQLQAVPGATQDRAALVEGAARIASQAKSDGLTAIDRLEVRQDGHPAIVAHQGQGLDARASQPLNATAFVQAPPNVQPQQDQAQQHGHGPRM